MEKYTKNNPAINEKDCRQLKAVCLFVVILSPLVGFISSSMYTDMAKIWLPFSIGYSSVFLLLYFLTDKIGFIQKNAYRFLAVLFYTLTFSVILVAYYRNFPEVYTWFIIIDILATAMLFKRIIHIIIYLVFAIGSTHMSLFLLPSPQVPKFKTAVMLCLFCLIVPIFMKTRLDTYMDQKTREQLYRNLVEASPFCIIVHREGRILFANSTAEKLASQGGLDGLEGKMFAGFIESINPVSRDSAGQNSRDISQSEEYEIKFNSGTVIYVEARSIEAVYEDKPATITMFQNITSWRKAEHDRAEAENRYSELVMQMAYHDVLTGLPNRYFFNEYTSSAILECKKNSSKLGIMYLDLDRFKVINDTLGHSFGDRILQEASERLNTCIRKGDIVCRLGGDEFVIVLKDIGRNESVQIAGRIIKAFSKPFKFSDAEVFTTTSIGLSFYPEDGEDVESLVSNADTAMYLAKESGKNNYQFYSSGLSEQLSKKMELENGLRKALINNEFLLHYQPQVDLKAGVIVGVEALIRWQHPVYGLVSPMEFIPLAEETGLINPIGEWVLATACTCCKAWHESGFPNITISVNVSGYQLQHSNFVRTVRKILEKTSLEPEYLVLEITESIMQDVKKTFKIINDLKVLGVKVAVDDFGIGYSSLNVLKSLKIDTLKIDPSFINDSITNPSSAILIKFIINMGHQLNYEIIAEGIENEFQAELLRQYGCHLGQGYYFSRPLSGDMLEEFLKKPGAFKLD